MAHLSDSPLSFSVVRIRACGYPDSETSGPSGCRRMATPAQVRVLVLDAATDTSAAPGRRSFASVRDRESHFRVVDQAVPLATGVTLRSTGSAGPAKSVNANL